MLLKHTCGCHCISFWPVSYFSELACCLHWLKWTPFGFRTVLQNSKKGTVRKRTLVKFTTFVFTDPCFVRNWRAKYVHTYSKFCWCQRSSCPHLTTATLRVSIRMPKGLVISTLRELIFKQYPLKKAATSNCWHVAPYLTGRKKTDKKFQRNRKWREKHNGQKARPIVTCSPWATAKLRLDAQILRTTASKGHFLCTFSCGRLARVNGQKDTW